MEVAAQYALRHSARYPAGVFFVSADAALEVELLHRLARALRLADAAAMDDADRLRGAVGGDLEQLASDVPTQTIGTPEDFGAVVAFLCSDHARFITGAAIPVDGGQHAGLQ